MIQDNFAVIMLVGDGERQVRIHRLDEHCYETMKRSYQPTTLRNLRSQALIYGRFCKFYGFEMFPASAWQLVRYARYIANTVTSYETVANYISGVRKLHRLAGYQVPDANEPNLHHIMRALKKELAHPIKQAVPVTPKLLQDIYEMVDLTKIYDIVCYTALLVGFYLFLRKSNLVPDSVSSFDPQKQLTRADIQMGKNIILVIIKWSKTIQYKEKELILPLLPARDIRICPVFWVKLMFRKVNIKENHPLFSLPSASGDGFAPLTYDQLAKRYKQWIANMGIPVANYTLHGLRKGGACHALEMGLVGEELKLLGDWASEAYMRYIDLSMQQRLDCMVRFMCDL